MNRLRHVTWCALAALALAHGTLRAQEKPATPQPAPAPAAAEPPTATPQTSTTAPTTGEPKKVLPSTEQRLQMIEDYFANLDPNLRVKTAKDKDGNAVLPPGMDAPVLTTNPGPGHNAWMMASAAL